MTNDQLVLEARNAELPDLIDILKDQRSRRLDMVIPAERLRVRDAQVEISGMDDVQKFEDIGGGEKILVEQFSPNGLYRPTRVFDEHVSARLDVPLKYVRRMREQRPDLYDANVNGWLQGRKAKVRRSTAAEIEALETEENAAMYATELDWMTTLRPAIPADTRSFMLRTFRGDADGGIARALMSERFGAFDNYDGAMALMQGISQAGLNPDDVVFDQLDLTERRLHMRVSVPNMAEQAPELLKGYRNPFAQEGVDRAAPAVRGHDIEQWRRIAEREGMGYTEEEGGEPIVFAGFIFSNSEVGNGAWTISPQIIVKVCKNGLTLPAFADSKRHVGAKLSEGVQWGHDTIAANLETVVLQTRDLVAQFLSPEFLHERVAEVEQLAGAPVADAKKTIEVVSKQVGFTDEQAEGILDMFYRGGAFTAGGVANAVTAYSQTLSDADEAHELDGKAVRALQLAAR